MTIAEEGQKLHITTNDKIPITRIIRIIDPDTFEEKEEEIKTFFVGLEESLREFNEENLNSIVNIIYRLSDSDAPNAPKEDKLSDDEYFELWQKQHKLLKQDYGFYIEQGHVLFYKSDASFHRENKKLMQVLNDYVAYCLKEKTQINEMVCDNSNFRPPKKRLPKDFKNLETKGGINWDDVQTKIPHELNVDNLLIKIGNIRKKNFLKL